MRRSQARGQLRIYASCASCSVRHSEASAVYTYIGQRVVEHARRLVLSPPASPHAVSTRSGPFDPRQAPSPHAPPIPLAPFSHSIDCIVVSLRWLSSYFFFSWSQQRQECFPFNPSSKEPKEPRKEPAKERRSEGPLVCVFPPAWASRPRSNAKDARGAVLRCYRCGRLRVSRTAAWNKRARSCRRPAAPRSFPRDAQCSPRGLDAAMDSEVCAQRGTRLPLSLLHMLAIYTTS